jgi:1-deoxy-D-xylulose-5-phosphate reductoisomerase
MLVKFNSHDSASSGAVEDVVIFGSTGSIGFSTLEIIRNNPGKYRVKGLIAGSNWRKLLDQVDEFTPDFFALANSEFAQICKSTFSTKSKTTTSDFYVGAEIAEIYKLISNKDRVVAAIAGMAGLQSVLESIKRGAKILLANKESLVVGGHLVKKLLMENHDARLLPIDSEHGAIFQLLHAEKIRDVEKLVLTASGGAFLNKSLEELDNVSLSDALKHPNWDMGTKVTIDSATMVNKALEVIEAHLLFDFPAEKIEVIIHPQSIIHSLVTCSDGVQLAHLSVADMKGAISYALNYPYGRISKTLLPLDLIKIGKLEFLPLVDQRFPAVKLAKYCINSGGNALAIFNASNEVAVSAFVEGRLKFSAIVPFIEYACGKLVNNDLLMLDELLNLNRVVEQEFKKWKKI